MPLFDYPKSQIHHKQIPIIKELVDKIDAKVIVEIGSWLGESTSYWAKAIQYKDGGIVYSVDWYKGNENTALFSVAENEDIYSIFRRNMKELNVMDSIRTFNMSSDEAVKFIPNGFADIVYIDASHDYLSIKNDIDKWIPKVRKGGIICGHDCEDKEYDDRFINIDVYDHKHHGVIKAVSESFKDFNITERIWWVIL